MFPHSKVGTCVKLNQLCLCGLMVKRFEGTVCWRALHRLTAYLLGLESMRNEEVAAADSAFEANVRVDALNKLCSRIRGQAGLAWPHGTT